MNLQRMKKRAGYFALFTMIFRLLTPGVSVFADVSGANGNTGNAASGSAIVIPTSTPKVTPTPTEQPTPAPTDNWKVTLRKVSHPKKINKGAGFDVKGILVSARKIKYVEAEIKNEDGKSLYKKKVKVNKKKFNLKKVDNALKFSKLNKGSYVYEVTVTDQKKNNKEVIEDDFSVKQPKWTVPIQNPRWGDGWHCHCGTHHGRHYGWDILGGKRTIHAASSGTVVYAKYHGGSSLGSFGKLIIIYHGNGVYSYYAHCSKIKVKAGEEVNVGDVIGKTGSSGMAFGAHLHFELRKGPEFSGSYNSAKLVDKYTYRQFNPAKKIKNR